jgi:hypothetical protein
MHQRLLADFIGNIKIKQKIYRKIIDYINYKI